MHPDLLKELAELRVRELRREAADQRLARQACLGPRKEMEMARKQQRVQAASRARASVPAVEEAPPLAHYCTRTALDGLLVRIDQLVAKRRER